MSWLLPACVLAFPFLALLPAFTPPEWWWSLHDSSRIAGSANTILWLEMRLGQWG